MHALHQTLEAFELERNHRYMLRGIFLSRRKVCAEHCCARTLNCSHLPFHAPPTPLPTPHPPTRLTTPQLPEPQLPNVYALDPTEAFVGGMSVCGDLSQGGAVTTATMFRPGVVH